MRNLYTIFKDMEQGKGDYSYPNSEDPGIPFTKVLEIAEEQEFEEAEYSYKEE